MSEKDEGNGKHRLVVIKQSWGVTCSIGNIATSIVATMCGASRELVIWEEGGDTVMYRTV